MKSQPIPKFYHFLAVFLFLLGLFFSVVTPKINTYLEYVITVFIFSISAYLPLFLFTYLGNALNKIALITESKIKKSNFKPYMLSKDKYYKLRNASILTSWLIWALAVLMAFTKTYASFSMLVFILGVSPYLLANVFTTYEH